MKLNRRSFLKNLSAGVVGASVTNLIPVNVYKAFAQGASTKHFLVLNLGGGLDSLYAFPYLGAAETIINQLRGNLAVTSAGRFSVNDEISMHNSFSRLNSGTVANLINNHSKFFTMAGIPNHNELGHEGAQKVMNVLSPNIAAANSGWIGRANASLGTYGCFGISSGGLAFLPNGNNPCMQISNLESYKFDLDGFSTGESTRFINSAKALLNASKNSPVKPALRSDVESISAQLHDSIPLINQIKAVNVTSANFSESGVAWTYIGNKLRDAAKIVLNRHAAGTSTIIEVSDGGYDSHDLQLNSIPGLLKNLSYALYGFLNEMITAGIQDSVTVLITSEFGRSNTRTNEGTDHGYGMTALTIGGAINGGPGKTVYGDIPDSIALSKAMMPVTQDIRNVYYQVLEWMGINPLSVITDPAFSVDNNLQLFV